MTFFFQTKCTTRQHIFKLANNLLIFELHMQKYNLKLAAHYYRPHFVKILVILICSVALIRKRLMPLFFGCQLHTHVQGTATYDLQVLVNKYLHTLFHVSIFSATPQLIVNKYRQCALHNYILHSYCSRTWGQMSDARLSHIFLQLQRLLDEYALMQYIDTRSVYL